MGCGVVRKERKGQESKFGRCAVPIEIAPKER